MFINLFSMYLTMKRVKKKVNNTRSLKNNGLTVLIIVLIAIIIYLLYLLTSGVRFAPVDVVSPTNLIGDWADKGKGLESFWPGDKAEWLTSFDLNGLYSVSVDWTADSLRPTKATYEVYDGNNLITSIKDVDQTNGISKSLGDYQFNGKGKVVLIVGDSSHAGQWTGLYSAGTVRFEKVSSPNPGNVCEGVQLGDMKYCECFGPCNEGEGNCAGNSECADGLVCTQNAAIKTCELPLPTPGTCDDDDDGDGFYETGAGCDVPYGYDCVDNPAGLNGIPGADIHPGAAEICGDNVDSNCNGENSENCVAETGVIVDNDDGSPAFEKQGEWLVSRAPESYPPSASDSTSIYSSKIESLAKWTALDIEPGVYEVYAWWTYAEARSSKVPYYIHSVNGESKVVVNQKNSSLSGRWNKLGESYVFTNTADSVMKVEESGGHSADAVSFIKIRNLAIDCSPQKEVCDHEDNDCDGTVDNGVKNDYYVDSDKDGLGRMDGSPQQLCADEAVERGFVSNNEDCNDNPNNGSLIGKPLSCSYNELSCGNYKLCVNSCPVSPREQCGNNIDENCNGNADDVCPTSKPILDIDSPEQNETYINKPVPLIYKVEFAAGCSYILDSARKEANCDENTALNLTNRSHIISIIGENALGESRKDINFDVLLTRSYKIKYQNFFDIGDTTNLDSLSDNNLKEVNDLVLENDHGKIEFLENVDLTDRTNKGSDIIDLDAAVIILNGEVEVKEDKAPGLDVEAEITLFDLDYDDPRILKDEDVCYEPDCEIESYDDGVLVFKVEGFTKYEVEETPGDGPVEPPTPRPPTPPTPKPPTPKPPVEPPTPAKIPTKGNAGFIIIVVTLVVLTLIVAALIVVVLRRKAKDKKSGKNSSSSYTPSFSVHSGR